MTIKTPEIIATLLVLGCATVPPSAGAPADTGDGADRCATPGRAPLTLAPDAPLETAVETVACAAMLARAPVAADRWYVRRHQQLDERTSPLEVATMILAFTEEGASHLAMDLESFGYIYSYARGLSLPRVEKELQSYPDDISRRFLARIQAALAKLEERAGRLQGSDRAVFVDLLSRVEREHFDQARALDGFEHETMELLGTVDAALGSDASRERLTRFMHEAEQLRESILVRCTDRHSLQDCLDGPLIRPLGERLARLALGAGDIPRATAEQEQLRDGADHTTLAAHLDAELRRALSSRNGAIGSDDVILDGDASTGSAAMLTWGPTVASSPAAATESAQSAATVRVRGVIKSYHSHPGGMEIVFEEGPPVVVPFAEAHVLKFGEKIEVIVDHKTRHGVVLYAHHYASERIVQFRGTRLGGTHGVEMATRVTVAR